MKVVVALPDNAFRRAFFTPEKIAPLAALAELEWNPHERVWSSAEQRTAMERADIVINGWQTPRITKEVFEGTPLKLICNLGSLKESLSEDVFEAGLLVSSANDAFAKPVAELTLTLLLMALRRTYDFVSQLRQGTYDWTRSRFIGESVCDKTIGILGYGTIAREVIHLLRPFGCRIAVCDGYCPDEEAQRMGFELLPMETFLEQCDAVCLHHTLTEETYHLLDGPRLRRMKDHAVIVNTARGALIDQAALIRELEQGRLFAALDVFEQEPVSPDSPLRRLPNVILTPHIGGYTTYGRSQLAEIAIADAIRFLKGETPKHLIHANHYRQATDMKAISQGS